MIELARVKKECKSKIDMITNYSRIPDFNQNKKT
jgi:hypothetical protein